MIFSCVITQRETELIQAYSTRKISLFFQDFQRITWSMPVFPRVFGQSRMVERFFFLVFPKTRMVERFLLVFSSKTRMVGRFLFFVFSEIPMVERVLLFFFFKNPHGREYFVVRKPCMMQNLRLAEKRSEKFSTHR